ncbi:MAG: recombinase RecA [Phycisphaerae bacterium]|nr:MAG: recombinase RecA [Planctomycetota bacterium]KAB2943789.1 MAG: recombinase RecA [Phycisphaerae bacterium]MBE7458443.1 recombinase RecA [Planctomycetia bacterium]MCK6464926.1 recombinase RecA [Phycisphaerae bacterium]MCL4719185.1 recombinase RecA [Phycisphaerae bacterium]
MSTNETQAKNEAQATKRKEALGRALQMVEKAYGKGAIMQLDQMGLEFEGISTGALSLDLALGGRGLPRGRIVEIFGPESSGKTTLALHVAAEAQKAGGIAAIIDAEHAMNPTWAKKCGVDLQSLLISQPESGEEALEITEMLVRSGSVDVIIVDSVASLIPKAELEGQMGDTHVALQARLMSQALRKLTGAISKTHCIVIFINQIRMQIGVMFGNPETTPGGRALKFYCSVRIDVRRISSIKEGETVIGSHIRAKIVKNKVAPPFREAELDILFDGGISTEGDLLDLAVAENIIAKSGAWFTYGDIRVGQGRENARQFLRDNPKFKAEIRSKVLAARAPHMSAAKPGVVEQRTVAAPRVDPRAVSNGDGRADVRTDAKAEARAAAGAAKRKR